MVDNAMISHRKRMNNVRVNALAGKYNIPMLKEFKFKIGKFACDFFHYREIINAIFENTPDSDLGLRNTVVSRCANARNLEKCLN
ncbi:hypothetical protein HO173_011946 [Letharia columbiana]|uniref:Uncharacterized protein n=1 Tax=Letharia columbiana TaxID=112416 RepID=A0A8H6CQX4_9LECA|nr:uncharacterized protein HO173_011946 [Letharia columbiana]KAF6227844.1 hypothetical protein HO173_011946 [Letharia columbiana]